MAEEEILYDEEDSLYAAIDMKSFFASVECVERGRDPLTTNLVVADLDRTEKTICLAVSPSLKAHGVGGRPRLFEVVERVAFVNEKRKYAAPGHKLVGSSDDDAAIKKNPALAVGYIVAPPRMATYKAYSKRIYDTYLEFVSPEDIFVYSIDEVFIDLTPYLEIRQLTAREMTMQLIKAVLKEVGITATAGIGTNMYLAKVAMDILAKRQPADADGVRIAELDLQKYRDELWNHQPLTDFWQIGKGYAKRLHAAGLHTMGDIARCLDGAKGERHNMDLLFKLFGVNARHIIAHAWGEDPATIAAVKNHVPKSTSLSNGQVLPHPYKFAAARLIVREMADALCARLVKKDLVADQAVLTVGYDRQNLRDEAIAREYKGKVTTDRYGRKIPSHSHGTENFGRFTSSERLIGEAFLKLFDRIANPALLVRRLNLAVNHTTAADAPLEMDLFSDFADAADGTITLTEDGFDFKKEKNLQKTVLKIKDKYGKNAIFKGLSLIDGTTGRKRNEQLGGHKA